MGEWYTVLCNKCLGTGADRMECRELWMPCQDCFKIAFLRGRRESELKSATEYPSSLVYRSPPNWFSHLDMALGARAFCQSSERRRYLPGMFLSIKSQRGVWSNLDLGSSSNCQSCLSGRTNRKRNCRGGILLIQITPILSDMGNLGLEQVISESDCLSVS